VLLIVLLLLCIVVCVEHGVVSVVGVVVLTVTTVGVDVAYHGTCVIDDVGIDTGVVIYRTILGVSLYVLAMLLRLHIYDVPSDVVVVVYYSNVVRYSVVYVGDVASFVVRGMVDAGSCIIIAVVVHICDTVIDVVAYARRC